MRARACLLVCSLAGLLAGGTASAATRPPTPLAYLDRALALMSANAVVAPVKGWPVVIRQARRMAAHAKKPADTYGAIIFALNQLYNAGDAHARFANPLTAKGDAQAAKLVGTTPTPPPSVSLLDGRIGVITVPAIDSPPTSPNGRRYSTSALSALSALETASDPCGWIIDLREDSGGNMYPMLLSLGPLLGNGPLIGFTGRSGFRFSVSYSDGVLSGGGYTASAPVLVPALSPTPPLAVLTGPTTASSGEAVAIALRGRQNTRSFGAATAGITTSAHSYRLADGALISFSVSHDVDRNGTVYTAPIPPDQPIATDLPDSTSEQAAEQWLLATPQCSHTG